MQVSASTILLGHTSCAPLRLLPAPCSLLFPVVIFIVLLLPDGANLTSTSVLQLSFVGQLALTDPYHGFGLSIT